MLREILAITGKPGLYRILSHTGKSLLVEQLLTGKRFPVGPRDKVVSLGDIAMYTEAEDKPLGEILDAVYAHNGGATVDVKAWEKEGKLREEFEAVVPDYDRDRVYPSDIKKLFTWYNLLVESGMEKFAEEEDKLTAIDEAEAETAEAED